MRPYISIKLTLLICLIGGTLFGQKLNRSLGEIIVEINSKSEFDKIKNNLSDLENQNIHVSLKQLTKRPLKLWLISIDHRKYSDQILLRDIKSKLGSNRVQFNRLLYDRIIPNDPRFSEQWAFINDGTIGEVDADLDIDEAWDHTTGGVTAQGDTIVTCVVDVGFANHEDLDDNLFKNYDEIPNDGIDNDNNGFVDDYLGWNSYLQNDDIFVGGTHGLSVTGVIGAKGNNEIGISGVNWDTKVMMVNYGIASEAYALAAYEYPYVMRKRYNDSGGKSGAFVVATNSSWGLDGQFEEDAPIWCAFYDALGEEGVINCVATSNKRVNVDEDGDLPSACRSEYIIAVTNITSDNQLRSQAGFGQKNIDIGAYGTSILGLKSNDGYSNFTGTSMAAPHVTGAIALIYSSPCEQIGNLSKTAPRTAARSARDLILESTEHLPNMTGKSTTGGRLNINNIIDESLKQCSDDCPVAIGHFTEGNFENGVKFFWINESINLSVDIRYRKTEEEDWKEELNVTSGKEFNNFDICSEYQYQVRSRCLNTIINDYEYTRYFESGGCCEDPEFDIVQNGNLLDLTILNISQNIDRQLIEYTNHPEGQWDSVYFSESTSIPVSDECDLTYFRLSNFCGSTSNRSLNNTIYTYSTNCESCAQDSYCQRLFSSNEFEWISNITLEDNLSLSDKEYSGYSAYLGKNTPKLKRGTKIPISVDISYSNSEESENLIIFIDWNQDGQFTDEEEVYFNGNVVNNIEDSILVPEDATLGLTRMRFRLSFSDKPTACSIVEYGETEDYCVKIVETTSLENENIISNPILYPNPTTSTSNIKFWVGAPQKLTLEIYSIDYKLMHTNAINAQAGENDIILPNIDLLDAGIYLVRIAGKNATISKKLIKY